MLTDLLKLRIKELEEKLSEAIKNSWNYREIEERLVENKVILENLTRTSREKQKMVRGDKYRSF